jgi:hypothetical protein
MKRAEEWSRSRGYIELGSDTEATNALSRAAHAALGFHEVETLVVFREQLQDYFRVKAEATASATAIDSDNQLLDLPVTLRATPLTDPAPRPCARAATTTPPR